MLVPVANDQQTIPAFFRGSLYTLLVVAGLAGLPFIGGFSPLPTTELLDVWVVGLIAYCIVRGRTTAWGLFLLLVGYLVTRIIGALATESPLLDFLQAYRWVLYLIMFALVVGRAWGPKAPLVRVTWTLLLLAVIKAGLTFVVLGPGERPGLLLENNFELALFAGLVAVAYPHASRGRGWMVILMGLLAVLAGSRSGSVIFAILFVYAVMQAKNVNLFFRYLLVLAIPVAAFVAVWIFADRAANSTQIDRLNFLDVFLSETSGWTPWNWLFGTPPITPLSDGGCHRLSYYQSLFSSVGDGSCYSVILHAFVLRVLFDAGIVGLLLALVVTWFTMRKGGVRFALAATLLLIAFANGMSVSGLNNPYVALPIILAIVTASTPTAPVTEPDASSRRTRRTTRAGSTARLPARHRPRS